MPLNGDDRASTILRVHYFFGGGGPGNRSFTVRLQVSNDGVEFLNTGSAITVDEAGDTPLLDVRAVNAAFLRMPYTLSGQAAAPDAHVCFDHHVHLDHAQDTRLPSAPLRAGEVALATGQIGLTVSCGRDNRMDNGATLTLSPKFEGDDKPHDLKIDIRPGADTEEIAEAALRALSEAAVGHKGASATGQSTSVSTGSKATGSGRESPTTTTVCLITITGIESVDVGCTDGKLRTYAVSGRPANGGDAAGGGGTVVVPHDGTKPQPVDCAAYRRKYDEKKAKADAKARRAGKPSREPSHTGQPGDWFCDPRRKWQALGLVEAPPPLKGIEPFDPRERAFLENPPRIGVIIVGAVAINELTVSALVGAHIASGWLLIPFLEIPRSRALQLLEVQQRLAAAGVVTQDRRDGVVVPTRFIAGAIDGEPVRAFGLGTPYDPLGYGGFAWTIVVGEPRDVAMHAHHVVYPQSVEGHAHPHARTVARAPHAPGVLDVAAGTPHRVSVTPASVMNRGMPPTSPRQDPVPQAVLWAERASARLPRHRPLPLTTETSE